MSHNWRTDIVASTSAIAYCSYLMCCCRFIYSLFFSTLCHETDEFTIGIGYTEQLPEPVPLQCISNCLFFLGDSPCYFFAWPKTLLVLSDMQSHWSYSTRKVISLDYLKLRFLFFIQIVGKYAAARSFGGKFWIWKNEESQCSGIAAEAILLNCKETTWYLDAVFLAVKHEL